jgi:hypothetical protein
MEKIAKAEICRRGLADEPPMSLLGSKMAPDGQGEKRASVASQRYET